MSKKQAVCDCVDWLCFKKLKKLQRSITRSPSWCLPLERHQGRKAELTEHQKVLLYQGHVWSGCSKLPKHLLSPQCYWTVNPCSHLSDKKLVRTHYTWAPQKAEELLEAWCWKSGSLYCRANPDCLGLSQAALTRTQTWSVPEKTLSFLSK